MKIPVYNQKAEVVGEVELNPKIFEVKAKQHLLAEAVRIQQSNARQGTAHTKTRGEVSGGGRKPWKQKGTGRARAGSIRSPIWRKGGITFGPRARRNWKLKLNKKAKKQALFMALSDKVFDKRFIVIEKIELPEIKTKAMVEMLANFKKSVKDIGKNTMLVLARKDEKIMKSVRNIQGIGNSFANSLNLADVIKAESLIVLKDSLPVIEQAYLKDGKGKS
ncbi:MAG: 50S ribosomal protein L4 [Candidatus Doudnabacteria bacterium]|nr:50S ribosomal protein L4 [Candidatus Doudnabacteria bacterium]